MLFVLKQNSIKDTYQLAFKMPVTTRSKSVSRQQALIRKFGVREQSSLNCAEAAKLELKQKAPKVNEQKATDNKQGKNNKLQSTKTVYDGKNDISFSFFKGYVKRTIAEMEQLAIEQAELQVIFDIKRDEKVKNEITDVFRDRLRLVTELYSRVCEDLPNLTNASSIRKFIECVFDTSRKNRKELVNCFSKIIDTRYHEDRVLFDNTMQQFIETEKNMYALLMQNKPRVQSRRGTSQYYVGMDTIDPTNDFSIDIWTDTKFHSDPDYVEDEDTCENEDDCEDDWKNEDDDADQEEEFDDSYETEEDEDDDYEGEDDEPEQEIYETEDECFDF